MGLKEDIAAIVIQELQLEDVTPETFKGDLNLVEDLGIDSMELATITIKLREKYKIKIDESDYPNLTTLDKVVEFIKSKTGQT